MDLSALLLIGSLFGCGSSESDAMQGYRSSGGNAGTGTEPGDRATPQSLEFEGLGEGGWILLAPGDTHTLRVVARPAGIYHVRFALFGKSDDAALDRNEADTAPDGRAEVVLTAPQRVTAFRLRASVGTLLETNAGISVGGSFATLQVQPRYNGDRPVAYWVASAHIAATCAGLPPDPPEPEFVDQSLPDIDLPTLGYVPIGRSLAVTLRSAHYIHGCTDVDHLVSDRVNEVIVPVIDVPLKVDKADLHLSLALDPSTTDLSAVLDATETLMFDRLKDGLPDDVTTLLDAMTEAADPGQRSAFASQRSSGQWDNWVTFALGIGASTELRRPLRAWIDSAREQMLRRELLAGRFLASQLSANSAELRLDRAFGYDPIAAGFSPALGTRLSITADPGDHVVVGGTLQWFPTQLLGRLVADAATTAVSGATSVPEALAAELSCDEVATELLKHGSDSTQVFPGCNLACTVELCHTAMEDLWQRMIDVTDNEPAKLVLSASGLAMVDEHAQIASVDGTWNANADFAGLTGKLTGPLAATAVKAPPPTQ